MVLLSLLFSACHSDQKAGKEEDSQEETAIPSTENQFLIIPGKRIGKITAASTLMSLEKAYGKANVMIKSIDIAEGEEREGIVVFPDSKNELEIVLDVAAASGKPEFVRINQAGTEWRTDEGISIGTSLDELEKYNGKAFTFYGFEWDYAGLITNWNGGKLSDHLIISLLPENADALVPELLGDVELYSGSEKVKAIRLKVKAMVVTF